MKIKEGFIKTKNGKVWFRSVGSDKNIPLIIVHGGPGCSWDYLESLQDLAVDRRIIFYEQIGSGHSDRLIDKDKWVLKTFVDELADVIKQLKLKKYHLLGQSWGAAIVTSFATNNPKGLSSIILSDPYISTPVWVNDSKLLIKKLPINMQKALNESTPGNKDFDEASHEYYARFVDHINPLPEQIKRGPFNHELYNFMWGPKEFDMKGSLQNLDLVPEIHKINCPTFFICGRFDEATPESIMYFSSLVDNSETYVFENSAHLPFWSDRELYMKTVGDFLSKNE